MVSSALVGGAHEALSTLGSAGKAVATMIGQPGWAQAAGQFAQGQRTAAQAAENPYYENAPILGTAPAGQETAGRLGALAYQVMKGLPAAGAILGGAVAAPLIAGVAPESAAGALLGGGVAAGLGYPLSFGGGVQTREAYTGKDVTPGEAGAAAALGVPEAAVGAVPLGRLGMLAGGGLMRGVAEQAVTQGVAGATQSFIGQQMGDPNRPIAQRAQEMLESALTGGVTGALFGAGAHALAKRAPEQIPKEDLKAASDIVDPNLKLLPPPTPAPIAMGAQRPYEGLSNEELWQHAKTLEMRGDDQEGLLHAAQEMRQRGMLTPNAQPVNHDAPVADAWAAGAQPGLVTSDTERLLPGNTDDQLAKAWTAAPRAVQPMPLLPSPEALRMPRGVEEPVHEPTVATVQARDQAGERVFDQKGNPVSTRAPIELGRTVQGEPIAPPPPPEPPKLLNAPPPTVETDEPLGPPSFMSGEVRKMPDQSAPIPATVRQMTEEAAQDAGVKRIPKTFQQATTLEDMQAAIRAKWEEAGPNKLVRKLAAKFDMLDENGDLKPVEPTIRDAVPAQHQGRFDALEAAKAKIDAAGALTPEAAAGVKKGIEDAQVGLASDNPGRGAAAQADKLIREFNGVAASAAAAGERAKAAGQTAPKAPAEAQPAPQAQPLAQPAAEPAPSPAAQARAAKLPKAAEAAPAASAEPVVETLAGKPGTRPGDPYVMKGTYKVSEAADAAIEKMNAVARNPSGKLTGEPAAAPPPAAAPAPGRVLPDLTETPALTRQQVPLFQGVHKAVAWMARTRNALSAVDPVPAGVTGKAAAAIRNLWQAGIEQHHGLLRPIIMADNRRDIEGLRSTLGKDAYFAPPDDKFQDAFERFSPDAQAAYQHYEKAATDASTLFGRSFPRADKLAAKQLVGSGPRNQMDVDVDHLMQSGATTRDLLQHIAENSADPRQRVLTRDLLGHQGVNPKIEYADASAEAKDQGTWPPRDQDLASYDPTDDTIRVYGRNDLERAVTHEAAHAGSVRALEAGGPAAKAFGDLFDAVKARFPKEGLYGLTDKHELLAEGFGNSHFRAWLDAQRPVGENVSLWQKFKDGVAGLLGFKGGRKTLLDQVLEGGRKVIAEDAQTRGQLAAQLRTPEGQETALKPLFAKTDAIGKQARGLSEDFLTNLRAGARRVLLGWRDGRGITDSYGKYSPGMEANTASREYNDLLNNANNKASRVAIQKLQALPKESQKKINAWADGTHIGLDATKGWGAHKDLFDKPNAKELMREHSRLNSAWTQATPAEQDAYKTTVSANNAHMHQFFATSLYNMLTGVYGKDINLPEGFADPNKAFQFASALHDDPAQNEKFWSDQYDTLAKVAKDYVGSIDGEAVKHQPTKDMTPPAREKARAKLAELEAQTKPLASLLGHHDGVMAELDRCPNFPMGREGSHFAAGTLKVGADGLARPQDVVRLQKMLNDGGFGHVTINRNLENPKVYARVDSLSQADRLSKIFQSSGVFEDGSHSSGELAAMRTGLLPHWAEQQFELMRSQLDGLRVDDKASEAVDRQIADMKREYLDLLPSSSLNKIMAKREGVQGYSGEVIQNLRQRMVSMSRALANLAAMPEIARSVEQMRDDVQAMNKSDNPIQLKSALSQAVGELLRAQADRSGAHPGAMIQALREGTHNMEVGLSPGYVVTVGSQLGTLTIPKLGSEAGHLKAFGAVTKNTKLAFDIMRTVAGGSGGLKFDVRAADFQKAGHSQDLTDFMVHQDNMGTFNHGGYTQAMKSEYGDPNSTFGKARGWASAMGLYAEMTPRVVTALAARDCWNGSKALQAKEPMHDFVHRMVRESQFDWNPTFNPRQTTRNGMFGSMSPLINQFMGYATKYTDMMCRETAKAVGGSPEAQKFLMGHVAASTVLAGTLGLPMAAVFASVYDRLADWATNSDDHDITASYRNYLSDTFGKDVGEVIARGLPRAFGIDLSHLGDQKMMPGSSSILMLTEKRKIEDAEKDWLKSEAGSAAGMLAHYALAARDISNGDYLNGLQKMVPEALRGPIEATRLGLYDYRDRNGMKLPISASAKDILMTAIGLDPAKEAEYDETKKTLSGVQNLSELRQQNITQHLALALTRGDTDNFGYWADQSAQYLQDHPGMTPPLADLHRFMEQHYRSAAFANAIGGPIGVRTHDLNARGMVRYGNLPGQ